MSKVLTIEGNEYVPASQAGKHFGYSRDYFLLLIKNGKVDGKKVGNKWYVNLASAESFFTQAKKEQEVRRRQMSIERKRELEERKPVIRETQHRRAALLETLVIVVIGLAIGATGYLGTTPSTAAVSVSSEYSFFERLAISLYRVISGEKEVRYGVLDTQSVAVNVGNESISIPTSTMEKKVGNDDVSSLVVFPETELSANQVEDVRNAFSDEVTVTSDPTQSDTGIVTPTFKSGEGESYRFLMVPVRTFESET